MTPGYLVLATTNGAVVLLLLVGSIFGPTEFLARNLLLAGPFFLAVLAFLSSWRWAVATSYLALLILYAPNLARLLEGQEWVDRGFLPSLHVITLYLCFVGLPLALVRARRADRKPVEGPPPVPSDAPGEEAVGPSKNLMRYLIKLPMRIAIWGLIAGAVTYFLPSAAWIWHVVYAFIAVSCVYVALLVYSVLFALDANEI